MSFSSSCDKNGLNTSSWEERRERERVTWAPRVIITNPKSEEWLVFDTDSVMGTIFRGCSDEASELNRPLAKPPLVEVDAVCPEAFSVLKQRTSVHLSAP